jgi:hypothetical protein
LSLREDEELSHPLQRTLWEASGAQQVLDSLDLQVSHYRLLTTLATEQASRSAFRLLLRDGRTVKLRRMLEEGQAEQVHRLREGLPPAFAGVLYRQGPVLIEDWVEGCPVKPDCPEILQGAAGLLRLLHQARPLRPASMDAYLESLDSCLTELEVAGMLSALQGLALRELALTRSPGVLSETLIHNDFCAENLVLSNDGRLFAIDNEAVRWGPVQLDLARVCYRWPMDWPRFLECYGADDPAPFWHVLARARGAAARVRLGMPRVEEAVARLCELLSPR